MRTVIELRARTMVDSYSVHAKCKPGGPVNIIGQVLYASSTPSTDFHADGLTGTVYAIPSSFVGYGVPPRVRPYILGQFASDATDACAGTFAIGQFLVKKAADIESINYGKILSSCP